MKSPSGETPQYLLIKAQLQARIENGALKAAINCPQNASCALFSIPRGLRVRESRRSWKPAA